MTGTKGPAWPDLLMVTHRLPFPLDKGERIRAFGMLRELSKRARVHLASLADEPPAPKAAEVLGRYCERLEIVPISRKARLARAGLSMILGRSATEGAFSTGAMRSVIRDWTRTTRFHAALATSSGVAPYLTGAMLQGVSLVVDLIDVDSQKWLDYAEDSRGLRSWVYRCEGRRLRRLETRLSKQCRALILISDSETALFRTFCPADNVITVRNGTNLAPRPESPGRDGEGCVFIGSLDYRPNVDGVHWFVREVWPLIRERRPGTTFRVAGRRPVSSILRLAEKTGVEVVGEVPDVRPYLVGAAVVVAPLRIARGVQTKVLEAMACGKPAVVTRAALEGLEARPGHDLILAEGADDWASAVLRLLDDASLRERVGEAGRAYVEAQHRWGACLAPLFDLLDLPERPDEPAEDCQRHAHVIGH